MKNSTILVILTALIVLVAASASARASVQGDSVAVQVRPDSVRAGARAPVERPAATSRRGEISGEERSKLKHTLDMMGRREVEGERLWQRRKSPKLAMYCNAVLPGLGQVYNGRRIKTALMVGAFSYYAGNIWLNQKSAQGYTATRDKLPADARARSIYFYNRLITYYKDQAKDYLWWSAAVWVIGILDAWIDAHLYDIRAYTPPQTAGAFGDSRPTPYVTLSFSF